MVDAPSLKIDQEQPVEAQSDSVTLMQHTESFVAVDTIKCEAFRQAIRSMKRGEKSRFTVSAEYKEEKKDEGMEEFLAGTPWDSSKGWVMDIEVVKMTKVEDWYGGKTAVMRTLRKGKGRNAYTDSTVYFRIKIEVNGETTFSNYQEEYADIPIEEQEDFKRMSVEQKAELLKDDTLICLKLDHYILPSVL